MGLTRERERQLKTFAHEVRKQIIETLFTVQTGHPGGSLSCVEILSILFAEKMHFDPKNPSDPDRDRLVLSKGHACPTLYAILAKVGFFAEEELRTFRQLGTRLQGHPDMTALAGVDMSSGPLGLGLSAGLGIALAARLDERPYHTYVLLGDGELQEGIVWEAAMSAGKYKADNLIAIVDLNGVQLDGTTSEIMPMPNVEAMFRSCGWLTIVTDGHDFVALSSAIDRAREHEGSPTVIIAKTIKGKGVSFMEGQAAWHGQVLDNEHYARAMQEMEEAKVE